MANEEQFVAAIELIADKLGVAATEIFSIFVDAQIVLGIASILECVAVLLMCVLTYFATVKITYGTYSCRKVIKEREERDSYFGEDDRMFIMIFPFLVAAVSSLAWMIIVSVLKWGFIRMMCPEYCAIIEIIKLI